MAYAACLSGSSSYGSLSNDDLTRHRGGFSFACRLPLMSSHGRHFAFWRPACDLLPNDGSLQPSADVRKHGREGHGLAFPNSVRVIPAKWGSCQGGKIWAKQSRFEWRLPCLPANPSPCSNPITGSQGERWTPAHGEPPDYGTMNFNRMRFEFEATLNQTRIKDDSILTHLDGQPPGRRAFSNRLLDRRGKERREVGFLLWGSGPFQNFSGAGEI